MEHVSGGGKYSPNVALQGEFHRRILKGARTISDTRQNNDVKFLPQRGKQGIFPLLKHDRRSRSWCRIRPGKECFWELACLLTLRLAKFRDLIYPLPTPPPLAVSSMSHDDKVWLSEKLAELTEMLLAMNEEREAVHEVLTD